MFSRTLLILALAMAVAGCSATTAGVQPMTDQQKEVIQALQLYEKAYENGDVGTLNQVLAEDLEYEGTLGATKDKASFLARYEKWYAERSARQTGVVFDSTYLKVDVSGDQATVVRQIDWTIPGLAARAWRGYGPPGYSTSGTVKKATSLRRTNGTWKISADKNAQ